ncbi:MAG: hypothetical protein WBF13_11385 [Candidatus Zixiibacteriota bacterium]
MKKAISTLILLIGAVFILGGCAEDEVYIFRPDHTPPSSPKGFYSVTGDMAVELNWEDNDERDLAGYRVYKNTDPNSDKVYYHATVDTCFYVDYEVENGHTYLYGVTAFDYDGNESALSKATRDTPRPDGSGLVLRDYHRYPHVSGYDFSRFAVVGYDEKGVDVYIDYDDYYRVYFLWAADTLTDIQDFGYTDYLDDVNMAPYHGWSQVGWVELIAEHSYIIWTRDGHFAKMRVTEFIRSYGVVFEWAYQTKWDEQELAPRPPHTEKYLRARPTHIEDDQR